jgi:polyisoprenoid-binding protein YceI
LTQVTVPGPINGQPASPAENDRLVLVGTVYDQNCRPVPGIAFDVWQTDSAGDYGPPSDDRSQVNCCYLGATVVTDEQGRYVLDTVIPGPYRGQANPPPSHVHAESEESPAGRLMTEVVFEGDEHLTSPGHYTNPPPVRLQAAEDEQGPYRLGVADFLLPGALPETAPAAQNRTREGAQTFVILPEESSASYQIREKFADIAELVSPVGVTRGVTGEIRLNWGPPPNLEAMTVQVNLTGLDTGEPDRDEKLYDNWLITREFPSAVFTATGLKDGPARYNEGEEATFVLSGDMTIRDVTRPVDFQVTARVVGATLTGQAETRIRMTDFGIRPPDVLGFVKVEDEVLVRAEIKAVAEE